MLEVGSKAPDFTLKNQNGEDVTLSSFKGKNIVLYFYPKDNTPGCTKQACGYGSSYPDFCDKNTVVIGISKDSIKSHKNFEEKYNLPFILISDPDLVAIKAFDVWHEKTMCGKKYMGVVRTTYIIDKNQTIIYAQDKVKAASDSTTTYEELTTLLN